MGDASPDAVKETTDKNICQNVEDGTIDETDHGLIVKLKENEHFSLERMMTSEMKINSLFEDTWYNQF